MKTAKLSEYKRKRNLKVSKEPAAKISKRKKRSLAFVVHEHHARRLHYDLRLEVEGVLKSWAIPKKPSLDPTIKRLAILVEDHPYGYKDFHGVIPSGYGAGTVKIWDKGTYAVEENDAQISEHLMKEGLTKGSLHIHLKGKKLKGEFYLVRLHSLEGNKWLFFKKGKFFKTASKKRDLSRVKS